MTDFVQKKMKDYKSFIFENMLSFGSYLTSSNLTHIDYQWIMFVWDKYGRFKLLFYK